jgi:hypothetical protein
MRFGGTRVAAKAFWLRPCDGACWHSPDEVVHRLTSVFDHVSADRDEARILGRNFLRTYRALLELGNNHATPLDVVERQWNGAIVVRVADDSMESAPFEVVVMTEDTLRLKFPPKASFPKKRRSAEKLAKALGYAIEHFDLDD